ncbi:hypothetical protein [Hydrogenophaga flava]|uniref:hypothetical protein n=1 Tax=Hydrogenophaga flava TaxID=65657 RepID=UPI000825D635|nr:hypothetical protein [Hydrogenophaga flava]
MSSLVFRKTESGKAEIAQRQAGLAPATRQLLILVNGVDSVQALLTKGLGDVRGHLDTLLSLRLIEPVPAAPRAAPSPPPAAAAPVPSTDPSPAPVVEADDPQRLLALQRRAWQTLQPHFGPDTPTVAQDLLAARSIAQYLASLDAIQAKLAIYMGRKQAEREVDALRR